MGVDDILAEVVCEVRVLEVVVERREILTAVEREAVRLGRAEDVVMRLMMVLLNRFIQRLVVIMIILYADDGMVDSRK
jgi:hypothetical protein